MIAADDKIGWGVARCSLPVGWVFIVACFSVVLVVGIFGCTCLWSGCVVWIPERCQLELVCRCMSVFEIDMLYLVMDRNVCQGWMSLRVCVLLFW